MQYIENRTFAEISIGESAELTHTLGPRDIEMFAVMSGDVNPAHMDTEYANSDPFQHVIVNGMWGGSLISALLGSELPGPGTIYLNQSLKFCAPVGIGDTVTVRAVVRDMDAATRKITLDCLCLNQNGETVILGEAQVIAPEVKVRRPRVVLQDAHLHEHGKTFKDLIAATRPLPPILTAVVHPCDAASLQGAMDAYREDLIVPILVGPATRIQTVAKAEGIDVSTVQIIDVPHSHAAALRAVALVREGSAEALMKGALHTDEVMAAVVDKEKGLRTESRMSHIFVMDVPTYPKPLLVTDGAINIYPDLETKKDIVQNAINLARALGIEMPKVAVLSAVETVYPKIASTVDAAALCKMADRGQITGGLVDGPLAFDNAVSKAAAQAKGITSPVAGDADILVAPDLEAGNMIAKQLLYLAGAESAGIVLGARVPIMLTSRADGALSRLASAALAQTYIHGSTKVMS